MARTYTVNTGSVAVSAAQDLLQIKGATGKMLRVMELWVSSPDTTLDTSQMLHIAVKYLPATVTDGSGGSTATPQPTDPGDAAASFTCKTNNTTAATTGGTASTLYDEGTHIYAGFNRRPGKPICVIGPSESLVLHLTSVVSGTVNLCSGAEVEEIGG
jgi:hypothetical protein